MSSQSGNDSKWFLTKIIFQNRYVALETPSRPPPFMAKTILDFHFDYLTTSLSWLIGWISIKKIRNVSGLTQLCPSAAPCPHRQPQSPSSPPPMATLSPSSLTSGRPFHLERQSKKTSGTSKWSSSQVQRLSLDHLTRFPSRPCSWVCWWGGWIQVKNIEPGTK